MRKIKYIDKRYTVAYTYAGIRQYSEFQEIENGVLSHPRINLQYNRNIQIPEFPATTTIDDMLSFIREKIDKNAKIEFINGMPVEFYHNDKVRNHIDGFHDQLEKFIEEQTLIFFKEVLEPIMVENGWVLTSSHIGMPVLAVKDEEGEWDNLRDREKEFQFEYLCYKFICKIEPNAKLNIKSEYGKPSADAFQYLIGYIPLSYLKEKGLHVEL